MKKYLLLITCLLFNWEVYAQTITRKGDTLIATPAKTYQWLKNGAAINGATNQKYVPTEKGNYTVRLSDISNPFLYKAGEYLNITGLIYNKKLEPVPMASVEINGIKTTSNDLGRYTVRCPKTLRTLVKVSHENYLSRSLGFVTTEADTLYKNILVDKFTATHVFEAKSAVMLGINQFTVLIPDSGIINVKTGKPHYGKVNAYLAAPNQNSALFGEQMPGNDFLGFDKEGNENILYSYGYFTCELKDEFGNSLNLDKNKRARITFKITDDQKDKLKENVPLWHFDEEQALWIEDGGTLRFGNLYTANVSHFSSWNVDWSNLKSWVEGQVLNCSGNLENGGYLRTGQIPVQINSKGFFKSAVPAGIEIEIFSSDKKEHTTPQLNVGQVYQVPMFTLNNLKGNGIFDATGNLSIYYMGNKGKVRFSADNGKTFQDSSIFYFNPDDSSPKLCVIQDDSGCEYRFTVSNLWSILQRCTPFQGNFNNMRSAPNVPSYKYRLEEGIKVEHLNTSERLSETDIEILYQYGSCLTGLTLSAQYFPTESANMRFNNLLTSLSSLQYVDFSRLQASGFALRNIPWGSELRVAKIFMNYNVLPPSIALWKKLESIELSYPGTLTGHLPKEIGEWKKLIEVRIDKLDSIPTEVGEWKKIENVVFNYGTFTFLPKNIEEWKNLKTFGAIQSRLDSLPNEVSAWKNIYSLNIEKNRLTTLPQGVKEWNKLLSLNAEQNKIATLPPEVGGWKNLQSLSLGSNQLTTLPSEAGEWKNLQELNIENNKLTTLPSEIGEWKKIYNLILNGNLLTTLPPEIAQLKDNLKNLYLVGNNFSKEEKNKIQSWLPNTTIIW